MTLPGRPSSAISPCAYAQLTAVARPSSAKENFMMITNAESASVFCNDWLNSSSPKRAARYIGFALEGLRAIQSRRHTDADNDAAAIATLETGLAAALTQADAQNESRTWAAFCDQWTGIAVTCARRARR